jgi:hypothetical protein
LLSHCEEERVAAVVLVAQWCFYDPHIQGTQLIFLRVDNHP